MAIFYLRPAIYSQTSFTTIHFCFYMYVYIWNIYQNDTLDVVSQQKPSFMPKADNLIGF